MNRRRGNRRRVAPLIPALGLALVACGGDGGPGGPTNEPDPGPLHVVVSEAPANTGGVLLEISGLEVGAVTALGAHEIWQREIAPGRRRVLVRGSVAAGALLRFQVPDRRDAYAVVVLAAAADGSGGWAPRPTSQVSVAVEPAG